MKKLTSKNKDHKFDMSGIFSSLIIYVIIALLSWAVISLLNYTFGDISNPNGSVRVFPNLFYYLCIFLIYIVTFLYFRHDHGLRVKKFSEWDNWKDIFDADYDYKSPWALLSHLFITFIAGSFWVLIFWWMN